MISSITKINNDLTMYIINEFKRNDMPINELVLQKVIYKLKMDLGENHSLYSYLPYYWYYYGPFSETVRESFDNVKVYLNEVGDNFLLKPEFLGSFKFDTVDEFPEVSNFIGNVISKGDYVYSNLAKDIYKMFSPIEMIYTFRFEIFNATQNDEFIFNNDNYVNAFKNCLSELHIHEFNLDYILVFSKLETQIDLLNDENLRFAN